MRQAYVFAATVALLIALPLATAHCPNFCSGHGDCMGQNECECFNHWMGGDCSLRRCPFGVAWADVAVGVDVAHQEAECSARGTCDHTTGQCACMEGYEGVACSRMTCPSDCSNHGTCRSMSFHASRQDRGTAEEFTDVLKTNIFDAPFRYTTNWDSHLIHGCECDEGYTGFDCSQRLCRLGDDELTTGQDNEVQVFNCKQGSGVFYLTYKRQTTEAIAWDATRETVEAALEALEAIDDVTVTFFDSGTSACVVDESNAVFIMFTQEFGDVPHILDSDADGVDITDITWDYNGACALSVSGIADPVCSVRGNKENDPCSGRGNCNPQSGVCECYTGYTTSNGNLATGERGDCGFAQDPITACPGHEGVECSGHGVCSGFPSYKCTCQEGWTTGECNQRVCPYGKTWFGLPTANDRAHFELVECSNKGICDRGTGQCDCQLQFEGEACERMTCPGQTGDQVCSGHGVCASMNGLADFLEINGDLASDLGLGVSYGVVPNKASTWDFRSVYGCFCDVGYEGYDCSERTCPFGDDMTTHTDVAEEQKFTCTGDSASGETLTFKFRQYSTPALAADSSPAELKEALENLVSIELVKVEFTTTSDLGAAPVVTGTLCDTGVGNTVIITFYAPSGDVPTMQVTSSDDGVLDVTSDPIAEFVTGTTEYAECAGRGLCDHSEGNCQCFNGFGSSNGNGIAGGRADCGYRLPYTPVTLNQPEW